MAITYPLALPSTRLPASIRLLARDVVGAGESPFSLSQQVQHFGGQRWEADVSIVPVERSGIYGDVAEEWVSWLLKLKGRYGTFLMGDPIGYVPRGTWAGSPQVAGAHAAGANTLSLDGFTAAATIKAGDYVQVGTGSLSRLHKALSDVTADGAGLATLDIWPNLREALLDNAAIVKTGAKGVWRLPSNERSWNIEPPRLYSIAFTCVEAL